jgi:hypothetical protein
MLKITFIILLVCSVFYIGKLIYGKKANLPNLLLLSAIIIILFSIIFLKYKIFTMNILSGILFYILVFIVIYAIIKAFTGKKKDKPDGENKK